MMNHRYYNVVIPEKEKRRKIKNSCLLPFYIQLTIPQRIYLATKRGTPQLINMATQIVTNSENYVNICVFVLHFPYCTIDRK